MTSDEIKQIKEAIRMNDIDLTLEIIKILEKDDSNISIKLLFDISKSEEWLLSDSAMNALVNKGDKGIKYLENIIDDENIEEKRKFKYLKQCNTPKMLRYLESDEKYLDEEYESGIL